MSAYQAHLEVIARILNQHCSIETSAVTPTAELQADLGLDSVGLLSLALEVENEFEIYLGEDTENPPVTIDDVIQLVTLRLEEVRNAS